MTDVLKVQIKLQTLLLFLVPAKRKFRLVAWDLAPWANIAGVEMVNAP